LYIPNNVFKAKKSGSALFLMSSIEGRELDLPEAVGGEFIMEFSSSCYTSFVHPLQCILSKKIR
jgi:hypothetical protein